MKNYKKDIHKIINKYIPVKSNLIKVYGGQTERNLNERLKQHKEKDNEKFRGMEIRQIFKTSDKDLVTIAETYLIKTLNKKYGDRCVNIQGGGGTGQQNNKGDIHKLYLMYSNKKTKK